MMRNEVDILEAWVRYHAQFLDRLIVADHLSIDGSLELARELRKDGLPIDILVADGSAYEQSGLVTQLARQAISDGADWVFPLDADEFLRFEGDLVDILSGMQRESPVSIPWQTYVPTRSDPIDETNILSRQTWRMREEPKPYSKVAVPRSLLQRSSVAVAIGSHNVTDAGDVVRAVPCPETWKIAHFPVRSAHQLARKVFVGWVSVLANPDRRPGTAHQWKRWFDALIEEDLTTLDPTRLAMAYLTEDVGSSVDLVHDPLPPEMCDFEIHRSGFEGVAPLKALARAAESLAIELGAMRGAVLDTRRQLRIAPDDDG